MTDIYTPTGNPAAAGPLLSADMRAEFELIKSSLNAAFVSGSWTPQITFGTPGDLSVTYSTQAGYYQKFHTMVAIGFRIVTSAFSHSTASGNMFITGLPFTSSGSNAAVAGLIWGGINKSGYSDIDGLLGTAAAQIAIQASGNGVSPTNVTPADVPSGGTVTLRGSMVYLLP